jgi:hypothetical protein
MKLWQAWVLVPMMVPLMGCDDDITGSLNVRAPFVIKDKKGKDVAQSVGLKTMNIDRDESDGRVELKLNFKDEKNKDRQAILKNVSIPKSSGKWRIAGASVGQAFDVAGDVVATESNGPQSQSTESCTYYTSEYVCHPVKQVNPDGTVTWIKDCGYEQVAHTGYKKVIDHQHYASVHADLEFIAQSGETLATWVGDRTWSEVVGDDHRLRRSLRRALGPVRPVLS